MLKETIKTPEDVLELINLIRESHPEAKKAFREGSCYILSRILCIAFPHAETYYDIKNSHVVTKIWDGFYDITGRLKTDGKDFIPIESEPSIYEQAKTWKFKG